MLQELALRLDDRLGDLLDRLAALGDVLDEAACARVSVLAHVGLLVGRRARRPGRASCWYACGDAAGRSRRASTTSTTKPSPTCDDHDVGPGVRRARLGDRLGAGVALGRERVQALADEAAAASTSATGTRTSRAIRSTRAARPARSCARRRAARASGWLMPCRRQVVDLDQQALAQVARADADRLERLQRRQHRLDARERRRRRCRRPPRPRRPGSRARRGCRRAARRSACPRAGAIAPRSSQQPLAERLAVRPRSTSGSKSSSLVAAAERAVLDGRVVPVVLGARSALLQAQAGRADRALQRRAADVAGRDLVGLERRVLLQLAHDRLVQRQAGELEHRARRDQAGRDPRAHLLDRHRATGRGSSSKGVPPRILRVARRPSPRR